LVVERREREVPRVGELDRELGRLFVPHLPHHHRIGVVAQDGAEGVFEAQLVAQLDLPGPFDDVLDRVLNREHVLARPNHAVQRGHQRRALPRSRRPGQDDHAVGLVDGVLEPVERPRPQPQLVEVRDDLPVVQHPDDDAFRVDVLVGAGNRHDGHPVPDAGAIHVALNEAVLGGVALEAIDAHRVVLDHRQEGLRVDAVLRVPVVEAPVDPEVDFDLLLGVRVNVDVGRPLPHRLHERRLEQVDERRPVDLFLELLLVDQVFLLLEVLPEVDGRLLVDPV
jgi:hypothetical protein